MTISKVSIAFMFIFLALLVHFVAGEQEVLIRAVNRTPLLKIDCGAACATRCRLSSRPRLCRRACGTCCARCDCVPRGTSGNYNACPCYANMTTHGNRPKCP
ncbi:Snakin-2 [Sesamum angolense]|uniref:Snakin-2 n=1 Tax=Sesamum angolense TaxID=2727404 RepID=A0AAE1WCH5_9LAMI|nr:Snakin-2 [Sesamum angolense]